MKTPIYTPKGLAKEYCDYTINIYDNCPHCCKYCFVSKLSKYRTNEISIQIDADPRKGILDGLKQQIETSNDKYKNKLVHLCFTCDPYPMYWDNTITSEIIKLLKKNKIHVQILTKNGTDCIRDFDLLNNNDNFGVTITCSEMYNQKNKLEPFGIDKRIKALKTAKEKGIRTWVSCEPIY